VGGEEGKIKMEVCLSIVGVLAREQGEGCNGAEECLAIRVADGSRFWYVIIVFGKLRILVGMSDQVLQSFEKIAKEILVDEVCVFGETFLFER
jgi:hypothetical protein